MREDRHELRGTLDSLAKEINDLVDKAYEFYLADAGPETTKLKAGISADFLSLKAKLFRLRKFNKLFRDQDRLFSFQDPLIGGDFEEIERKKRQADDEKLERLEFASRQLIAQLEMVYDTIYKPSEQPSAPIFVLIIAVIIALAASGTLGFFQYLYLTHAPRS